MVMSLTRPGSLLLLSTLLLGACSSLPPAPVLDRGDSEQRWQLRGKVGVWAGDTRESVRVNWLQCGAALRIDIAGAVGGTAARLSGDEQRVVLQRAGEPDRVAADADTLLADMGWPMPASALRWWVFARPVPNQPQTSERNDQGQLDALEQLGWMVAFDRYRQIGERELPAVIDLRRNDVRFKLLVAEHELQPAKCDTP